MKVAQVNTDAYLPSTVPSSGVSELAPFFDRNTDRGVFETLGVGLQISLRLYSSAWSSFLKRPFYTSGVYLPYGINASFAWRRIEGEALLSIASCGIKDNVSFQGIQLVCGADKKFIELVTPNLLKCHSEWRHHLTIYICGPQEYIFPEALNGLNLISSICKVQHLFRVRIHNRRINTAAISLQRWYRFPAGRTCISQGQKALVEMKNGNVWKSRVDLEALISIVRKQV